MKDKLFIQCALETEIKEEIKKTFKSNHMSIASYVTACLIKKAKELEENETTN